ncbi:MAG: RNA polymerase factor sigma-54 [Pseudomonadota bacterium]
MQGLRLELRQTQQLVMTPQLQQAIRLLQMTNLELEAHVATEIEKNPLLELVDGTSDADAADATPPSTVSDDSSAQDSPSDDPGDGPGDRPNNGPGDDPAAALQEFDTSLAAENLHDMPLRREAPLPLSGAGTGIGAAGGAELPERPANGPDLRSHLSAQLRQMRAPSHATTIALCLVEALEDDGYLREPLQMLALRLRVAQAEVEEALTLLQRCDPTGVGARDLAECLSLQLAERDRLDPMMRALLANLDLLARGDARRLATATGAEPEDIADMLADLRRLDPRPGTRYAAEEPLPRVPDVLLARARDGGWEITLNPETLPRVQMDETFMLRLDSKGRECDRWIAERRSEAQWLLRSMAKRAETILTVTREIVRAQGAFFDEGPSGLRPLTLRRVAEETGLHESTVSRVAANKLIATPRGVFELKFFFMNAVGDDTEMAAETVRQRLRALVASEEAEEVFSDDELVQRLRAEGIDIARRTVAKYRKMLRIPSSVERRRRKAFA